MVSKLTLLSILATILLINVSFSLSLEFSEPLHRIQRAIDSEKPIEELNDLIDSTLSKENVNSLLRNALPTAVTDLDNTLANQDLLQVLLNAFTQSQKSRLALLQGKVDAAGDDIKSVVFVINFEIGGAVLKISNDTLGIDADAVGQVILNYCVRYIRENYPKDIFLRTALTEIVKGQVNVVTTMLRELVAHVVIPLDVVKDAIAITSVSTRTKREVGFPLNILIPFLRQQLAVFLTPIQTNVNSFLVNATTSLLSLYSSTQPSGPIAGFVTNVTNTIVLRMAEVIVVTQGYINGIFLNLINGTVTETSRKRRDLDVDFDFARPYAFDNTAIEETLHNRVRRATNLLGIVISWIGSLFSGIIEKLHIVAWTTFINFLSSQYETIGRIVTTPLRVAVNWLINVILPCSSCASSS